MPRAVTIHLALAATLAAAGCASDQQYLDSSEAAAIHAAVPYTSRPNARV
jgi:hypothetical protein